MTIKLVEDSDSNWRLPVPPIESEREPFPDAPVIRGLKTDDAHPNQYAIDDKWLDMKIRQETIKVKGGRPRVITVRETRFGPVVTNLARLIKTRPEYARFYRAALAGRHPQLVLEKAIDVPNFMPELILHRYLYGTFQLFVGDIRIFRVVD